MKCKVLVPVILFCSAMLPPACAQLNVPLEGKIPFDFHIGDRVVPAGNYRISSHPASPHILLLRGLYPKPVTLYIATSTGLISKSGSENPLLIFRRYGRAYFLAEVWQGLGRTEGLGLRPSKTELVKAREMAALPMPENAQLASVIFTVR
jgi:hypothetical protein